jgi:hypothetical protein
MEERGKGREKYCHITRLGIKTSSRQNVNAH